jgi:hypothetical protein
MTTSRGARASRGRSTPTLAASASPPVLPVIAMSASPRAAITQTASTIMAIASQAAGIRMKST